MEQRSVTEVEVGAMLERATGFEPSLYGPPSLAAEPPAKPADEELHSALAAEAAEEERE